jgi:hypothetical protein
MAGWEDKRLESAMGRATRRVEDNQRQINALTKLMSDPKVKPEQRQRIQKQIERYKTGAVDRDKPKNPEVLGRLGQGIVGGIANALPGAADLVGTGIEKAAELARKAGIKPAGAIEDAAKNVRGNAQETMMQVNEAINPEGDMVKNVGQVAGGMAGGWKAYGNIARVSAVPFIAGAKRLAPEASKKIAQALASSKGGRRIAALMAANVAEGLPINLLQYTSMEDFPKDEKIKQLLIGVGADAVFGAAYGAGTKPKLDVAAPGQLKPDEQLDRAALIEKITTERNKKTAEAEAKKLITGAAKKEWISQNPTKDWTKLPKVEKDRIIAQYQAREAEKIKAAGGGAPVDASTGGAPSAVEGVGGGGVDGAVLNLRSWLAKMEEIRDGVKDPVTKQKIQERIDAHKKRLTELESQLGVPVEKPAEAPKAGIGETEHIVGTFEATGKPPEGFTGVPSDDVNKWIKEQSGRDRSSMSESEQTEWIMKYRDLVLRDPDVAKLRGVEPEGKPSDTHGNQRDSTEVRTWFDSLDDEEKFGAIGQRGLSFDQLPPDKKIELQNFYDQLPVNPAESWFRRISGPPPKYVDVDADYPDPPMAQQLMSLMDWDYIPQWEELAPVQRELVDYIRQALDDGIEITYEDVLKQYDLLRNLETEVDSPDPGWEQTESSWIKNAKWAEGLPESSVRAIDDAWRKMPNDQRRKLLRDHNIDPGWADYDAFEWSNVPDRVVKGIIKAMAESKLDSVGKPGSIDGDILFLMADNVPRDLFAVRLIDMGWSLDEVLKALQDFDNKVGPWADSGMMTPTQGLPLVPGTEDLAQRLPLNSEGFNPAMLRGRDGDWLENIYDFIVDRIGRTLSDAEYNELSTAVTGLWKDLHDVVKTRRDAQMGVSNFIDHWIHRFARGLEPRITGQELSGEEWWDGMGIQDRDALLRELGIDPVVGEADQRALAADMPYNQLPLELRSRLETEAADRFKIGIDVGVTVDEPSAEERFSALKLDNDAQTALDDLIIDNAGNITQRDVDRFAAEWELDTDDVVRHLRERIGWDSGNNESIVSAAIRLPDGTIIEGTTHGTAWADAKERGLIADNIQYPVGGDTMLFRTNTGRYVSREEAYRIAESQQQFDSDNQSDLMHFGLLAAEELHQPLPDPTQPLPNPDATPPDQALSPHPELSTITDEQLDALKETLFKRAEAGEDVDEALADLAAETLRRKHSQPLPPDQPPAVQELPVSELGTVADRDFGETLAQRFGPREAELRKLVMGSPRKLKDEQLAELIEWADMKVKEAGEEAPFFREKLSKLLNERAQRNPPPPQANMPRAVGAFAAGIYGGITADEDESPLLRFLVFAGGAYGATVGTEKAYRMWKPKQPPREFFPGEGGLPKAVINRSELTPPKKGIYETLRKAYIGAVRGAHGIEHITQKHNLPAEIDPGKLAATFGRYVSTVERWITNQPVVYGTNGEPVLLENTRSIAAILADVGGDMDGLGRVVTAMHSLERDGIDGYKAPMDQVHAELIISNAPPEYIKAAQDLRQYNHQLAWTQVLAGNLSDAGWQAMGMEAWYAPMYRIFGNDVTYAEVERIARGLDPVPSPNPLEKRKKGARRPVLNPVERTIEMTPKYLRAMEYAKIKQAYIGFVRTLPKGETQEFFLKRVERGRSPNAAMYDAYTKAVQRLVPSMSKEEALNFALNMGLEKLDATDPVMTVFEDGVLRSYKVPQDVFDVFKSMLPGENDVLQSWLGRALTGVTQTVTKGVVLNPAFIGTQTLIDSFQAALQSRYGFRVGIDSFRGWWAAVSRSPEYQKLLDLGGPATIQSLPYATDPTQAIRSASAFSRAKAKAGKEPNALQIAAEQIRELHPIDAYKTLVTPFAEAARVGEALRALDHGASTLEAVYAAWHATGNTRMEGSLAAVRAWHRLSLFSRPAISALDEFVASTGGHPFRTPQGGQTRPAAAVNLMLKGMAWIGIPTATLWYLNKDDEEIRQLRQTESGSRYWFGRTGKGEIFRVRKPHVIGQLFGTTMEAVLDQMNDADPVTIEQVLGGIVNDAAVNMIPAFGVVPLSLWSNKQIGLNSQIVPNREMGIDPRMMGRSDATMPARIISDNIAPGMEAARMAAGIDGEGMIGSMMRRGVSPAGIDFIARNVAGMLGQDGMAVLDAWYQYEDRQHAPVREELPFVGRFMAHYPSANTRYVREYYDKLDEVDQISRTVDYLTRNDPGKLGIYINENKNDIINGQRFLESRDEMAKLWRAIADVQMLYEAKQMDRQKYKELKDLLMNQIIVISQSIVMSTR